MRNKKNNTIIILILLVILAFIAYIAVKPKESPIDDGKQNGNGTGAVQTPTISGDTANFVSFSIAPGQKVSGKIDATGTIKGGYFFEANIVVKILDANKNVLRTTNGIATPPEAWMTAGPVPFTTSLDFTGLPAGNGFINIQNDNPSGDIVNEKNIFIPVLIN